MIAVVRRGRRKTFPWEVWLDDRHAIQDLPDELKICTGGGRTFGRFATERSAKLFCTALEKVHVKHIEEKVNERYIPRCFS